MPKTAGSPWKTRYNPREFIFRPGGTAAGNVYTDFALLYQDAYQESLNGVVAVIIDDSATRPAVIPAATYNFENIRLVGRAHRAANAPSNDLVRVTVTGVTIQNCPHVEGIEFWQQVATVGTVFTYAGTDDMVRLERVSFQTTSAGVNPLFLFGSSSSVTVDATYEVWTFGSSAPVIGVTSAVTASVYMQGWSNINRIDGVAGATLDLRIDATTTSLAPGSGFGTVNRTFLDDGARIGYSSGSVPSATTLTAAIDSVWSAVPRNSVRQAPDQLLYPDGTAAWDSVSTPDSIGVDTTRTLWIKAGLSDSVAEGFGLALALESSASVLKLSCDYRPDYTLASDQDAVLDVKVSTDGGVTWSAALGTWTLSVPNGATASDWQGETSQTFNISAYAGQQVIFLVARRGSGVYAGDTLTNDLVINGLDYLVL